MASDMIWGKIISPIRSLFGTIGQGDTGDPRVTTFPQAIRMSRWRPATPRYRMADIGVGKRTVETSDYNRGDLRTDRVLRTRHPSVARRACHPEIPKHRIRVTPPEINFEWHPGYDADPDGEDRRHPPVRVMHTAIQDVATHEFLPLSQINQESVCFHAHLTNAWTLDQHRLAQPDATCGRPCNSCRLSEYYQNYPDNFSLTSTRYALDAFMFEFWTNNMPELFALIAPTNNLNVFDNCEYYWKTPRDASPQAWHKAMQTSAYILALLRTTPAKAQTTFVQAGGVRIPTWEWAHKGEVIRAGKQWHCLGWEILSARRVKGARLSVGVCLIQDISNQDYAMAYNTHLKNYYPAKESNCFEKANAIDMLIGLGRLTARLTPDHKQAFYQVTGDLESLSRFWEQILNREASETDRLRGLRVIRLPGDEEDDSCGETDTEIIDPTCNLESSGEEKPRRVWEQILTFFFLFKDAWPKHTGDSGFPIAAPESLDV